MRIVLRRGREIISLSQTLRPVREKIAASLCFGNMKYGGEEKSLIIIAFTPNLEKQKD